MPGRELPLLVGLLLLCGCALRPVDRANDPSSDGGGRTPLPARILSMRIHGADAQGTPPILRLPSRDGTRGGIGSDALTLELDMQSDQYPNIVLQLVHCDREWRPTENIFVQDPARLRSTDFQIERSAVGVRHFDYHASITFPSRGGRIAIEHSGNYIARIIDYYENARVLGEQRFFVVEPQAGVSIDLQPGFFESAQSKSMQHGLKIRVEAEPSYEIFAGNVVGIALYRGGRWRSPVVAGFVDTSSSGLVPGEPWTRWYPAFAGKAIAEFGNVPVGNEHRILDLTDVGLYPSGVGVVTTPLSDIPRRGFTEFDRDGMPVDNYVSPSDADYVNFEFRLDLKGTEVEEDVFVIGTFNDWLPTPEWQMHYDSTTGFYVTRGLLRRGVHEYEYVAGEWDADAARLRFMESTAIEGNDRMSNQLFLAMVYYRETSAGGFDRIVGVGAAYTGFNR